MLNESLELVYYNESLMLTLLWNKTDQMKSLISAFVPI